MTWPDTPNTWRKALIHALSYLSYNVLNWLGKRTQPFDPSWEIVGAAWIVKDRRKGM